MSCTCFINGPTCRDCVDHLKDQLAAYKVAVEKMGKSIADVCSEVAGWRSGNIFRGPDGNPWGLNDRCSATNMHPDLQARIAREMEKA